MSVVEIRFSPFSQEDYGPKDYINISYGFSCLSVLVSIDGHLCVCPSMCLPVFFWSEISPAIYIMHTLVGQQNPGWMQKASSQKLRHKLASRSDLILFETLIKHLLISPFFHFFILQWSAANVSNIFSFFLSPILHAARPAIAMPWPCFFVSLVLVWSLLNIFTLLLLLIFICSPGYAVTLLENIFSDASPAHFHIH